MRFSITLVAAFLLLVLTAWFAFGLIEVVNALIRIESLVRESASLSEIGEQVLKCRHKAQGFIGLIAISIVFHCAFFVWLIFSGRRARHQGFEKSS